MKQCCDIVQVKTFTGTATPSDCIINNLTLGQDKDGPITATATATYTQLLHQLLQQQLPAESTGIQGAFSNRNE